MFQLIPLDVIGNSNMDPCEYHVAVYTGWNAGGGEMFLFLVRESTRTNCIQISCPCKRLHYGPEEETVMISAKNYISLSIYFIDVLSA